MSKQPESTQTVKIDDIWFLDIGPSYVRLFQKTKTKRADAKHAYHERTRGFFGHVDEALKSYLRKSINPVSEVSEIVELIESNVSKLKAKGLIK